MENLWPEDLNTPEEEYNAPNKVLKEQSEKLMEITNGIIYTDLSKRNALGDLLSNNSKPDFIKKDFNFNYELKGKYLDNYSYRIFSIHYNISIYPITILLNDNIVNDIGLEKNKIYISDFNNYKEILKKVFNSNHLKQVITAMIQLSKE